jgi:predicted regulator of Ras-like GTPase activity (Roadblock/LC7/MglB family)
MTNAQEMLNKLLKVEGITVALIVDEDGFVIASAGEQEEDVEAIGVMVTTGLRSSQNIGKELNTGALIQTIAEFENSTIVIAPIGTDTCLAIITEKNPNLVNIRYHIKKYSHELMPTTSEVKTQLEVH